MQDKKQKLMEMAEAHWEMRNDLKVLENLIKSYMEQGMSHKEAVLKAGKIVFPNNDRSQQNNDPH